MLATVRQSFHPWLGYEVNYSYTRFSERYSTLPFGVQNNLHEVYRRLSAARATPILGLQPFGAVGVGALIFLPTTVGGQKYNQQRRIPLLYEVGVNYPIFTSHFGLRFQYRGLVYKTPDFNSALLTTTPGGKPRNRAWEPTSVSDRRCWKRNPNEESNMLPVRMLIVALGAPRCACSRCWQNRTQQPVGWHLGVCPSAGCSRQDCGGAGCVQARNPE